MNSENTWQQRSHNHASMLLIGHGAAVTVIGLIAGIILIFVMLEGFILWPIMDYSFDFAGSVRGWKASHVGGLTNGLLVMGVGLVVAKVPMGQGALKFVTWSFVATGWGNTIFYWAANFAPNRAISVEGNQYGDANLAGLIGFVGGGSVMLFTTAASIVLSLAAFRAAKDNAF